MPRKFHFFINTISYISCVSLLNSDTLKHSFSLQVWNSHCLFTLYLLLIQSGIEHMIHILMCRWHLNCGLWILIKMFLWVSFSTEMIELSYLQSFNLGRGEKTVIRVESRSHLVRPVLFPKRRRRMDSTSKRGFLPPCGDWFLDLATVLQLLLHLKGPFFLVTRALSPGPSVSQHSLESWHRYKPNAAEKPYWSDTALHGLKESWNYCTDI